MFLFFIFYVFSSTKPENWRAEQVLDRDGGGVGTGGRGMVTGKGVGGGIWYK
jgi:hypothetical protein